MESKPLPQTKEEYAALKEAIMHVLTQDDPRHKNDADLNFEPNIYKMVLALLNKNLKRSTVEAQVVNFFRAFDDYKDA